MTEGKPGKKDFQVLLLAQQDSLKAYIRRHASSAQDAEDILQESNLKACLHYPSLRDPGKLKNWLQRIALNEIRQGKRKERKKISGLFFAPARGNTEGDSPEQAWLWAFDLLAEKAVAANLGDEYLFPAALRYCAGWDISAISACLNLQKKTTAKRLERFRKMPLFPEVKDQKLLLEKIAEKKFSFISYLWKAAVHPTEGAEARNSALAHDLLHLAEHFCQQHPESSLLRGKKCLLLFSVAHFAEYQNNSICRRYPWEWRRELWDQNLRGQAIKEYQIFQTMSCDSLYRLDMEFCHLLFSPAKNLEVDWKRLLSICMAFIDKAPQTTVHLNAAYCHFVLSGAKAAAKYLEELRKNIALKNNRLFFLDLGFYYFQSWQYKKALAVWRKFLTWPSNQAQKKQILQRIKSCEQSKTKRQNPLNDNRL